MEGRQSVDIGDFSSRLLFDKERDMLEKGFVWNITIITAIAALAVIAVAVGLLQ